MSAAKMKSIFVQGDKDNNGFISVDELAGVLKQLGDNTSANDIEAVFKEVDANHDGKVSFDEFVDWLMAGSHPPAASLGEVFAAFCGGHCDMENKQFIKLCKDTHLVDKKLTTTDVDLIFAKVATKGQRRISFDQFKSSLVHIAEKKSSTFDEISQAVCSAGGPKFTGTVTDNVKFYDDKTTFTGTWAHGGPEHVAKGGGTHADDSWKRATPASGEKKVDARPHSEAEHIAPQSKAVHSEAEHVVPQSKAETTAASTKAAGAGGAPAGSVKSVFTSYCGSHSDMDGKTFAKLCKDSHLLDKKFTSTDVDLCFAKVLPKGQRRIGLPQFETLLQMIATKKGVDVAEIESSLAGGPVLHATSAEACRFYDDKESYTGTWAHGGPEHVAKGGGSAADSSWKRPN